MGRNVQRIPERHAVFIDDPWSKGDPGRSRLRRADASDNVLVRLLRAHLSARRARSAILDGALLSDPAWELVLDLLISELEGTDVSISSACVAMCVAETTALRWIAKLEECEAIVRVPDAHDKRRVNLHLSYRTREAAIRWAQEHLDSAKAQAVDGYTAG